MITAKLMCGIGNVMFQIAAATSLAIDNNDLAYFNIKSHRKCGQGFSLDVYKNNILRNVVDASINIKSIYNEPQFSYKKIEYLDGLEICGCFQSEKYFLNNKPQVIKMFSPPKEIIDKLNYFLFKTNTHQKTTVSLHIRRGDYLMHQNSHRFIGLEYINSAISKFKSCLIYVFSDDIFWCRNNIISYGDNDVFFIDESINLSDFEQLYLMSLCSHNVISNSSFSWWGSYLNTNKDKIVIAPDKWFCDNYVDSYNDIYYDGVVRL
jgi:hypothetical protein